MLRPAQINKVFDLATDLLTCLWGGLIAPKFCEAELKARLPFPNLISFSSSFPEDSHLSTENYFNICASEERFRSVANHACCIVTVFAFESLKNSENYSDIENETVVIFLRHLRNAAAHGNSFNFKNRFGQLIDPGEIEWKGKIIRKELQDQTAFPEFFRQGDFAHLFEDISKIL